jgi:hypothetical protein
MKAIAFYKERNSWIDYSEERRYIDQQCAMAELEHLIIDESQTLNKTNGNVFYTYQEMFDAYPTHKFVILDSNSSNNYATYDHSDNDVIYCIGHDYNGWDGVDLTNKDTFKIKTAKENTEWHSFNIALFIASDVIRRIL